MDKINNIFKALKETSEAGQTVWVEIPDAIFASDTRKIFKSETADGQTKFEAEVKLDKNLKYSNSSKIVINNENLIDGSEYCYARNIPEVNDMCKWIYYEFLDGPNSKFKKQNEKNVYNSILESIGSKQGIRKKKLKDILGGVFG